jgi:hypothetical protein
MCEIRHQVAILHAEAGSSGWVGWFQLTIVTGTEVAADRKSKF